MGEVTVSVAGRSYQLICDDGEEARLLSLAARIDAEAKPFQSPGAGISEARLLLMSALMLADKLDEAEVAARTGAPQPAPAPAPVASETAPPVGQLGMFAEEEAAEATAAINAATARIEELTPEGRKTAARATRSRKSSVSAEAERDLLALLNTPGDEASADTDAANDAPATQDPASQAPDGQALDGQAPDGQAPDGQDAMPPQTAEATESDVAATDSETATDAEAATDSETAAEQTAKADTGAAADASTDEAPVGDKTGGEPEEQAVDVDAQIAARRARRAARRARLAKIAKEQGNG